MDNPGQSNSNDTGKERVQKNQTGAKSTQETLARLPMDLQPIDEQPMDEQPIDQQIFGQHIIGHQPISNQPVDQQQIGQQSISHQPNDDITDTIHNLLDEIEQYIAQQPLVCIVILESSCYIAITDTLSGWKCHWN